MAMRKLQPAIQYSQGRSTAWGGAELINCFSELAEGDKADTFAVMAIPGLLRFSEIGGQPVRGLHVMQGVLYAVVGATLYSISSTGVETSLGTVAGDVPVQMADNGADLAIQSVNVGYVLSGGVLYTGIANLPAVSNVVYIDGYFVWTVYQSDQFIISALNDGLTYDATDVATVEGDPDDIVGCVNDHRELQFYGGRTVEIWYNSGAADFPFARQGNAFIERGCLDRDSIVKIDNSVHFVGEDKVVYRLNGYEPQRISTHAIEYQITGASWFRGFTYTQLGHKFYILNTDVGCFGYDMATGAWHERRSLDRTNYRLSCAAVAYGHTIGGDGYTGLLHTIDFSENTEDGDAIVMVDTLPSIQTSRDKNTLYAVEAQIQAGVGTLDDPDPQIILEWSRDGGNTWSPMLYRPMGTVGEYLARCIWRLGISFRQVQLRLTLPSRVPRFVVAVFGDVR